MINNIYKNTLYPCLYNLVATKHSYPQRCTFFMHDYYLHTPYLVYKFSGERKRRFNNKDGFLRFLRHIVKLNSFVVNEKDHFAKRRTNIHL